MYNNTLEICGLFFLTLTVFDFVFSNPLPNVKNRVFGLFLCFSILYNLSDIAGSWMIDHAISVPLWLIYFSNILYFLLQTLLAVTFIIFFFAIDNTLYWRKKKLLGLILIFPVLCIGLILSTPFTKYIFYFDASRVYFHGSLFFINYIVFLYSLFVVLIYIILNRNSISCEVLLPIAFFCLSITAAVCLQAIYPKYLLSGVAVSLAAQVFCKVFEDPYELKDNITGLYNNTALNQHLRDMEVQRKDKSIILVRFRKYLTATSAVGNESINEMARQQGTYFKKNFKHALLFRNSREEFTIIFNTRAESERAIPILEKRFSGTWVVNKYPLVSPFLLCYAPHTKLPIAPDRIISYMERILKRQEESDSDELVVSLDKEQVKSIQREISIKSELIKAIEANNLEVYVQPIHSQKTGNYPIAEALVRFTHPTLGKISPDEFIPIAEDLRIVSRIDELVLRKVCEFIQINNLSEKEGFQYITVNLSAVDLMVKDIGERIIEIINQNEIPSNSIHFEITETAATLTKDQLIKAMRALKSHGISLGLDDFGSGYANLTRVLDLPFSTIKIDKSLLPEKSGEYRIHLAVFESTLTMLNNIGFEVIIEGVEESWQNELIIKNNVDLVQGYYFARPIPIEQYVDYFEHPETYRKN